MKPSELIQLNVENLIAFWYACGVGESSTPNGCTLHASVDWPYRLWFAYDDRPADRDIDCAIGRAKESRESFRIPIWRATDERFHSALAKSGYEIGMTQELMAMPLEPSSERPDCQLTFRDVKDRMAGALWSSIAGESFGYYIHEPVISGLIGLPGFELVIAYDNETPVGTGLLLKTDCVAGIHTIGVPPAHRRKGYARQIMHGLLARAIALNCEYSTLQASAAGEPLYRQLGYLPQGSIHTYRKKKSTSIQLNLIGETK